MPDKTQTYRMLRNRGFRLTRARKAMIDVLLSGPTPLSASELKGVLEERGVPVNKTTVYREVEFLLTQKIIREIQLGDGRKRFEPWPENHHHHLVCVLCKNIECIELKECLISLERRITSEKNFKLLKHSLEFFGHCGSCGGPDA